MRVALIEIGHRWWKTGGQPGDNYMTVTTATAFSYVCRKCTVRLEYQSTTTPQTSDVPRSRGCERQTFSGLVLPILDLIDPSGKCPACRHLVLGKKIGLSPWPIRLTT